MRLFLPLTTLTPPMSLGIEELEAVFPATIVLTRAGGLPSGVARFFRACG